MSACRRVWRRRPVQRLAVLAVVAVLLVLQTIMTAPMAAAAGCGQAPAPQSPGQGLVAVFDPPTIGHGDPTSVYGQYRYAGQTWYTYTPGCDIIGDPAASSDTWIGNQLFNAAKNLVAATNGLHDLAASDRITAPIDHSINNLVHTVYTNVYAALVGLVLLIVAVLMFARIWRGDFAATTRRGLWVLAALWTASSFLVIVPIYQQLDQQFFSRVDQLENAFLPATPGQNPTDVFPDELHDQVVYRTWLRGEFGSDTTPQAQQYGPQLLQAQAWSVTDTTTPATTKNAQYQQIAGQLGPSTGYFTGEQGDRVGDGLLALIQALAYTLFLLAAQLAILLAQVLLRVFILATPLIGLVGLLSPQALRRVAQAGAGIVLHLLVLATLAGINVFVLHLLFTTGSTPITPGMITLAADTKETGQPTAAMITLGTVTEVICAIAGRTLRRIHDMTTKIINGAKKARNTLRKRPAVREAEDNAGRKEHAKAKRPAGQARLDQLPRVAAPSTGGQIEPVDLLRVGKSNLLGDFEAPAIWINQHGQLTNGTYTLDSAGMDPHVNGTPGKSQFGFHVNSGKAILDAAAYADAHGLWRGAKAKVPVTNGIVGQLADGTPTSWINIYRTRTRFVHGSPGNPP